MSGPKDSHLTIRLPGPLSEALDAEAARRGVARSQVVREAVATYVAAPLSARRAIVPPITAAQLAERWHDLPHLSAHDAELFAVDVACAREDAPPRVPEWE